MQDQEALRDQALQRTISLVLLLHQLKMYDLLNIRNLDFQIIDRNIYIRL